MQIYTLDFCQGIQAVNVFGQQISFCWMSQMRLQWLIQTSVSDLYQKNGWGLSHIMSICQYSFSSPSGFLLAGKLIFSFDNIDAFWGLEPMFSLQVIVLSSNLQVVGFLSSCLWKKWPSDETHVYLFHLWVFATPCGVHLPIFLVLELSLSPFLLFYYLFLFWSPFFYYISFLSPNSQDILLPLCTPPTMTCCLSLSLDVCLFPLHPSVYIFLCGQTGIPASGPPAPPPLKAPLRDPRFSQKRGSCSSAMPKD